MKQEKEINTIMKNPQTIISRSIIIILSITAIAVLIAGTINRIQAKNMPETKISEVITISRKPSWFDYEYTIDYIENTQNTVSTKQINKDSIIIDNTIKHPYLTKRSSKILFIANKLIYLHISQKDYVKLQNTNTLTYDDKGDD